MLNVSNLEVSYGKIKALHGISLRVEAGEVVTLIGANGAGKSSCLKTLSGLLKATAGTIEFHGTTLNGLPPHKITQLGMVQIPEGRRIFPRLSVLENLTMGAFFRKDTPAVRSDRDRVLDMFPVLRERLTQMGGTLSGGEQQMLAFARALMGRPKLLTLVDPSMGLAPIVVEKVFAMIRELSQQGMTILLVEQNARAALTVAQRGYVLETGTLILEGSSKDLLGSSRVKECYLGIQENLLT
jgi:branched-chain amino acid transport system ATP-binding protein